MTLPEIITAIRNATQLYSIKKTMIADAFELISSTLNAISEFINTQLSFNNTIVNYTKGVLYLPEVSNISFELGEYSIIHVNITDNTEITIASMQKGRYSLILTNHDDFHVSFSNFQVKGYAYSPIVQVDVIVYDAAGGYFAESKSIYYE